MGRNRQSTSRQSSKRQLCPVMSKIRAGGAEIKWRLAPERSSIRPGSKPSHFGPPMADPSCNPPEPRPEPRPGRARLVPLPPLRGAERGREQVSPSVEAAPNRKRSPTLRARRSRERVAPDSDTLPASEQRASPPSRQRLASTTSGSSWGRTSSLLSREATLPGSPVRSPFGECGRGGRVLSAPT